MIIFNMLSTSTLKQQTCIKRDWALVISCQAIILHKVTIKIRCHSAWRNRVSIRGPRHSWRTFLRIHNIRVMIPCWWGNKKPWPTAPTHRDHSWFCQINMDQMQFWAPAKETWRAANWVKWIWIQIWNTQTPRARSPRLRDWSIQAVLRADMHMPKPKPAVSNMRRARMLVAQTESRFLIDICKWSIMIAIFSIKIATTTTEDTAQRTLFLELPPAAAKAPSNQRQDQNSTPCSMVAIQVTHIKVQAPNQVKLHPRLTKTPIYQLRRSSNKKAWITKVQVKWWSPKITQIKCLTKWVRME